MAPSANWKYLKLFANGMNKNNICRYTLVYVAKYMIILLNSAERWCQLNYFKVDKFSIFFSMVGSVQCALCTYILHYYLLYDTFLCIL